MPTIKPTIAAQKKATNSKPANTRHGQRTASRKRQVSEDSESSSDKSTRRSQKRQRQKGKGKKPVPVPVESVEESSAESSDEPDVIDIEALAPESNIEGQRVQVRSIHVRLHVPDDGL
jgi:hypothetical protein